MANDTNNNECFDIGNSGSVAVSMHKKSLQHNYTFSVCTMLASNSKYRRLLSSFRRFGFSEENTEFLAVDNRDGNSFDGYSWTQRMLPECKGKYIIFCHDDVELVDDGYDVLVEQLEELFEFDPAWAIAGNAGGIVGWTRDPRRFRLAVRISDQGYKNTSRGNFPVKCESLDENFIVMRRDNSVVGSSDLEGFHLFGTDLCLRAELAGQTSYVINFHLYHHGKGTKGPTYRAQKSRLQRKYRKYFSDRGVSTSTEIVSF